LTAGASGAAAAEDQKEEGVRGQCGRAEESLQPRPGMGKVQDGATDDLIRGGLDRVDGLVVVALEAESGRVSADDAMQDQLGLAEEQLAPSYDVLRDVGNCSSATVLLVLERLAQTIEVPPGSAVVAMAFGPGLTLYAALLRQREG
jgi:hypothetical protein